MNFLISKNKYPQHFFDVVAKALGIKWTMLEPPTTIPKEEIPEIPLPPPSGILYYNEIKYKDE